MKESDKKWKWSFLNNTEIKNQESAGNDKYSFLIAQQAQAQWEKRYEFDVYLALHKRWLCTICSEYVTSGEKWSTEHVKFRGQPTRTFETHKNSKGHKESVQKQIDVKRMLAKGNIYQQAVRGSAITNAKRRTQIDLWLRNFPKPFISSHVRIELHGNTLRK